MDTKINASVFEAIRRIRVSDVEFEYLKLQRGRIADLADAPDLWLRAYRESLLIDYATIAPHLPNIGHGYFLDIGGGLSGISVAIYRHYNGGVTPVILDGISDPPKMALHRQTYSNLHVAAKWLASMGVTPVTGVTPEMVRDTPLMVKVPLVLSLNSWCFHYAPSTYLDFVKASVAPRGTIIVDVRKNKPEWRGVLEQEFHLKAIAHISDKFDRCVFEA